MEKLIQDLRYGMRTILKQPGFTAIAVIALALGIGANTAIFSIVNAVLLRPLPFANPDGIMMVFNTAEKENRIPVSYPDFIDWRERQQSFELLSAYSSRDFTLTGTGDPVRLRGAMVTGELLPILGVQPKLGRFFRADEDKPGVRVAILSHRMWQEHFASDPDICDKTIQLHGQSYSVAGVMPKGFAFPCKTTRLSISGQPLRACWKARRRSPSSAAIMR
jgi:putative ABC transport system permease protein